MLYVFLRAAAFHSKFVNAAFEWDSVLYIFLRTTAFHSKFLSTAFE